MQVCVFEDRGVASLEPLTLTRPAFELVCGMGSLVQRQMRVFGAAGMGAVVRPMLAELCKKQRPDFAVNDADWLGRRATVFVNARWLPAADSITDRTTPRVGCVGDEVAFAILPQPHGGELSFERVDEVLAQWKQSLRRHEAGGVLMAYPWDLVDHNPQALCDDFRWRSPDDRADSGAEVVGPRDRLAVAPTATIEPFVVADTLQGPVVVDRGDDRCILSAA